MRIRAREYSFVRRAMWHSGIGVSGWVAAVLFCACGGGDDPPLESPPPGAGVQDPNFGAITDVLGGRRHLLRKDDLVVIQNLCSSGSQCNLNAAVLQTSHSSVAHAQVSAVSAMGVPATSSALALGRMFDLLNDVTLAVYSQSGAALDYYIHDALGGTTLTGSVPDSGGTTVDYVALADFDRDGFAELVVHDRAGKLRIATAADVTDMNAGLLWAAEGQTVSASCSSPIGLSCNAFATGDFAGIGHRQVALVHPGSDGQGLTLTLYDVDPDTLAITQGASTVLPIPDATATHLNPALAAGRFGGALHDQLALVYSTTSGSEHVGTYRVASIDIDAHMTPALKATHDLGSLMSGEAPEAFVLRSGQLNWFAQFDQAVLFVADDGNRAAVRVLTFDPSLSIGNPSALDFSDLACGQDLALGNFDHRQQDGDQPNPNLQLAILWQPGCNGFGEATTFAVNVYDVDPQNAFQLASASSFTYRPAVEAVQLPQALLVAGDTQGRSLLLGPPQKVTVLGHIQPDIVLGIPPMHVDFIRDVHNLGPEGSPAVLNISVKPSLPAPSTAFNTEYTFSDSSSTTASRKSTTSYSFSTKETFGEKIKYGVPKVASITAELKEAAKQTHDSNVATEFNTYSGVTDSLSATTGFADHLFFSQTRFNIYYYPVIRHSVCPETSPDCAEHEMLPLHVQFSGPDMVTRSDIDATTQEWYQPPWEPGNVFSYPWSLTLLQKAFPGLSPLTTNPAPWRGIDTSASAYTTTWMQGAGSSQSSGSVSSASAEVSASIAAEATIQGFGISGSVGFEVNGSQSVSTLNAATQTVSQSTGIRVNKPEFSDEVADNYLYDFGGYVFGQAPPTGTLQTIPLNDAQGHPIAIQSTGPMMVGFVADPRRENLPWWLQAYTHPDVGLNHPERWDWNRSMQEVRFNFAEAGTPPLDQPFYRIKGLFITPADAQGNGPQVTSAKAGDQLTLQARVYNFSLADMPMNANVHVSFHGQAYHNGNLVGDSFLIGERVLGPIPGFNSASNMGEEPNWALASTAFDTTTHADRYLVFWVLVWMQDGKGDLIEELEGHGLTEHPMSRNLAQITDVPTEPYSNNVGFYGYNTPFYVRAPGALGSSPSAPGDLVIEDFVVPDEPVLVDTKARVAVQIASGIRQLGSVPLLFYDGDPLNGGRVFDLQTVPALQPGSSYTCRVFFRPQTAGEHQVFVVAAPGSAAEVRSSATLMVTAS